MVCTCGTHALTKLLLACADRDITHAMKALIELAERMRHRMYNCK